MILSVLRLGPPSGQHVFVSACACLSFDAHDKHLQSMAAIHHPGVGGWRYHLQVRVASGGATRLMLDNNCLRCSRRR